jgi:hypothetical protein
LPSEVGPVTSRELQMLKVTLDIPPSQPSLGPVVIIVLLGVVAAAVVLVVLRRARPRR